LKTLSKLYSNSLLSSDQSRVHILDQTLFGYEFVTALLLRTLQLSIPDETAAQMVSLASAVGEMGVRQFFFTLYLKHGLQHDEIWTEDEKLEYAKRGKMRVVDATNDMLVEYLSSIMAATFLIYLAPTNAFNFASSGVEVAAVVRLLGYQLIPEIGLDFFMTFQEMFCGLRKIHEVYWDRNEGRVENSSFMAKRVGYLVSALWMKLGLAVLFTAFVLTACVR
jgi:hypothetical protein